MGAKPLDQVLADALYCDHIGRVTVDLGRWPRPRVQGGWVTTTDPSTSPTRMRRTMSRGDQYNDDGSDVDRAEHCW
ncbi:hypothetical protein Q5425_26710 [Amycolatopsis sp. A133]|uniref:hypothetical protein n=1 Tax=Amycolatopsis sp. A133 TaxID=3064472 RepID=UPI0027F99114|nr:hypothetical protein [Amycolatopsis sp. A133]MDQ7807344.1 hypothetical protein [Amycolatopsis sp. A133]